MSLGYPRSARITRGAELQRIGKEGKRIRTRHLEVRATSPLVRPVPPSSVHDSDSDASETISIGMRVGLIVPRYKQSAVDRNRVKRRLRELARLRMLPSGLPFDLVIRIRPDAYAASFDELANEIAQAMAQLTRWVSPDGSTASSLGTP